MRNLLAPAIVALGVVTLDHLPPLIPSRYLIIDRREEDAAFLAIGGCNGDDDAIVINAYGAAKRPARRIVEAVLEVEGLPIDPHHCRLVGIRAPPAMARRVALAGNLSEIVDAVCLTVLAIRERGRLSMPQGSTKKARY